MKRILFITIAAALLSACGSTETKDPAAEAAAVPTSRLDEVSWMIGTWEMQAPDGSGVFTEQWQRVDDNNLSGTGMMLRGTDTVFSEKLQLVNEDGALWYVPTIGNQNGGQPVRFKEKSISENELVFENLSHDFPQRIIYQRKGDNALYARVEGMQSNALRKEEFSFKRKAK
jgi:hypothetical protein